MAVIVQKLRKVLPSDIERGIKYFALLSCLNDLRLTRMQTQVLAYTSCRGTITSHSARTEFVEMFDSSFASLENTKGILVKRGWLVRSQGKYKVNPAISINFSDDIVMQIILNVEGGRK